uniref:Heterogeneous nuclear ribonucleoprotein M n=1 Tax=Zosterops lateralis melanops TaxID=1220523 RepID=A0A8D2PN30_ZOSLA
MLWGSVALRIWGSGTLTPVEWLWGSGTQGFGGSVFWGSGTSDFGVQRLSDSGVWWLWSSLTPCSVAQWLCPGFIPPGFAVPAPPGAHRSSPSPRSEGERPPPNEKKKEKGMKRGGNRFEPYANPAKRYRAFITNIPFDVKWQSLKDLVKEKVGEVTYVELLMDAEGKSRVTVSCPHRVVEFKMEESMKKAAEVLNKHSLGGRPLKVKEDPDGEHARRAMQKVMAAGGMGIGPGPGGPGMINIPPSILNNPNIPNEIIHALQAGRLGSTVFVANLDYKVGWKKLKEVFSMAGVVVRADILEDKDGKSRGIGTVTFEQAIEAVQAISMFNGQLLFDRPMHVKMDERAFPKGDFFPPERPQQLPHGLGGIGMGLGPGGQPIDANHINKGMGMGNMRPGGKKITPMLLFHESFKLCRRLGIERMGAAPMDRMGLERIGAANMERMGPPMGQGMGAGMERMGLAMGSNFERPMEMERGNFAGNFAGSLGGAGGPAAGVARKACQIFVRNLPFDFTWKMLKDKFNECGHVLYADIKMENGKSKGCGVVRFESPEVAERACRMMNGLQLRGREIDVRIDRNA